MTGDLEGALKTIEEAFGDRMKRGAPPSVLPRSAEEVELLAGISERFSVPLVALGAGTLRGAGAEEGSILVRFDLMRGVRVRGDGEAWVRAEPGASWLELDDHLSVRGWGLAVYPTSAPRATVGGWLAEDGIGVGSYQFGRTRENVLSADVVFAGGCRTVRGEDLGDVLDPEGGGGIVVAATLRTRRADHDTPFAVSFESPENLAEAVTEIHRAGAPLWHLAFLNGEMARARRLEDGLLLFGAYPADEERSVEGALREAAASHGGKMLPPAGAYRVWGQRFFPVAPSHPTPTPADRKFVSVAEIQKVLRDRAGSAVQGTLARSGQVLTLDLGKLETEPARSLD